MHQTAAGQKVLGFGLQKLSIIFHHHQRLERDLFTKTRRQRSSCVFRERTMMVSAPGSESPGVLHFDAFVISHSIMSSPTQSRIRLSEM